MLAAVKWGRSPACSTTTSAEMCWRTASVCSTPRCCRRVRSGRRDHRVRRAGPRNTYPRGPGDAVGPRHNPKSASEVQARDTAFYIFTSGTTGHPKASVMTHQRWLRALGAFGGLGLRLKGDDTLYCPLPLYHNNALTVAVSR